MPDEKKSGVVVGGESSLRVDSSIATPDVGVHKLRGEMTCVSFELYIWELNP